MEEQNEITLLYFYTEWCGVCRSIKPHLLKIEKKIKIKNIDCDEDPNLANQYNIKSVPTLVLLKNNKETNRHVGHISEEKLLEFIK